jgi:hypothetical protein
LIHKHLGIDKIIETIIQKLGHLKAAYIIGDYAKGKDSGTIELLLVGDIDEDYLNKLVKKAKTLIHRDIKATHMTLEDFSAAQPAMQECLLLWSE